MGVAGRKPKPEGEAVNKNKPAYEWVEVPRVPFKRGPKLPREQPNGLPWPLATRKWWKVISSMPHCILWDDGDWEHALDTAAVKAAFHMTGSATQAAEVRRREALMGMTFDSRRDLRIKYVDVVPDEPVDDENRVTNIDDYRDL